MIANNAYNQYRENSVYTASPQELTLMLYNGLVRFIMQAIAALENEDYSKVNNSIIRAEEILLELQSSLDMKYELSQSMLLLYDYLYRRLLDANLSKSKSILEEVLGFAKEFRDVWEQAMKAAKLQQRKASS